MQIINKILYMCLMLVFLQACSDNSCEHSLKKDEGLFILNTGTSYERRVSVFVNGDVTVIVVSQSSKQTEIAIDELGLVKFIGIRKCSNWHCPYDLKNQKTICDTMDDGNISKKFNCKKLEIDTISNYYAAPILDSILNKYYQE